MASNENQQSAQQPQAGTTAPTAATTSQPGTTASTSTSSTTTTAAQNASAAAAASQKANANIIAALSSAFKTSTGESLQHDKIAQLLIANMDQISELARQGRLSQAQIEQLKQFATGNVPAPAASTSQQQSQAKPATQPATTQAVTTAPVPVMALGTAATTLAAASGLKTSSPGPNSAATWTTNPESQFPISSTLNVMNPGPQPFPAATGRPTLSGGFAAGRVLSTPAQIARTDDNSVLSSDTSNRRKNTPNDQSNRRSIQDLVFSIDPNVKIEPDVEDLLLDVADEFIDSVTNFGCRLAKHRGGDTLEVRDLQLHLERNHNIRIPGFASDETRISISQSAIAPVTGATGPSSGKKGAQNANVTLRSQRLAQVAQAKKEAKLM
ncbi:TAF12 [Sanghuangporus weigelae]